MAVCNIYTETKEFPKGPFYLRCLMSYLNKLKQCRNQKDLANILDIPENNFTYIVFANNITSKYQEFSIPKKSGGKRNILAPNDSLKELQSKLADFLSNCYDEIEYARVSKINKDVSIHSFAAHGFRRSIKIRDKPYNFDIYSNARKHIRKKYVLNIDIENFFETISFSRIIGYFCNNKYFSLNRSVAILIAQVATYRPSLDSGLEGYLPQGSPLSPIISNLIGSILDFKILRLAKKHKLSYSRYADDLTLSTNMRDFPRSIAYYDNDSNKWIVGNELKRAVESSRFFINHKKTRLHTSNQRQEVTSLTVNNKVNINNKYYKYTRSMVYEYCKTGKFYKSSEHRENEKNNPNSLNGILSFIYYIKTKEASVGDDKKFRNFEDLNTLERLYVQFLFHNYFVYPSKMIVICEGFTDTLHLKIAYNQLFKPTYKYINFTYLKDMGKFSGFMRLEGSTTHIIKFLYNYKSIFISNNLSLKPCIILVDGDNAGNLVVNKAKDFFKNSIKKRIIGNTEFYHVYQNLYLIQLGKNLEIEDLYCSSVLETKIDNRVFNNSNESFDLNSFYTKNELYDKVVKIDQDNIDFKNFAKLFQVIHFMQFYHYLYWISCNYKKL